MKSQILSALIEAKKAKVPVALLTVLGTGRQWVVEAATLPEVGGIDPDAIARSRTLLAEDRSERFESASGPIFIQVFNPPFRLILVGAVHIAQPLAQLAGLAGYDVLVIDPRAAFAEIERFAGLSVDRRWPDEALAKIQGDPRTALVTLTHDPKLDDPALDWALHTPAFYIGALGSRKTHESRLQRLAGRGFSAADGAGRDRHFYYGANHSGVVRQGLIAMDFGAVSMGSAAGAILVCPVPCVGAVVLAAGLSSRMAPARLLMNLGDRPLIRHAVQTAIDTGLNPVTVVVGHDGDAIRAAVEGLPVRIVGNDSMRKAWPRQSARVSGPSRPRSIPPCSCSAICRWSGRVICVRCWPHSQPNRTVASASPLTGASAAIRCFGARATSRTCWH